MRRNGLAGATMAAVVVALTCLLGVSSAGAQTYPGESTLTLSTPTVPQGGTLSATMTGCAVGQPIHFVLTSDPIDMGTVPADSTGKGTVTITIPIGFDPGAHTVTSTCGTQVLTANVQVLSQATTPTTRPAVTTTSLPVTGSDSDLFVRAGVGFVAVGGLLVAVAFAARRRSSAA